MDIGFIGSITAVAVSVVLFRTALRELQRIRWWLIAADLILVGPVIYYVNRLAGFGDWANIGVFLEGILFALVALAGGIWMMFSLPKWHKLAALFFIFCFPAMLLISYRAGTFRSPESVTRNNGDLIVAELNRYHTDTGYYPKSIEDLESKYQIELPTATTNRYANWYKGWLYTSDQDTFILGYTDEPDRYGTIVDYYDSKKLVWESCVWYWGEWGPLPTIPPTRQPCLNDEDLWIDTPECRGPFDEMDYLGD